MRIFWRETILIRRINSVTDLEEKACLECRRNRKPVCPEQRVGKRPHKAFEEVVGVAKGWIKNEGRTSRTSLQIKL